MVQGGGFCGQRLWASLICFRTVHRSLISNKNSVIKENREMDHNAPCVDIDECHPGTDVTKVHVDYTYECDINAHCQNSFGSYYCVCNNGYAGDGKTCERLIPENAECRDTECIELRCMGGHVINIDRASE